MEEIEEKIQRLRKFDDLLRDEVNFLKQKLNRLEDSQILTNNINSNILSENPRPSFKPISTPEVGGYHSQRNTSVQNQRYNIPLDQNIPLEFASLETNFKTLENISEEEKIDIIKSGFKLNQEGKISLKKYYEGVNSLFQWKGFRTKYESIQWTKIYKNSKIIFRL